MSPWSAAFCFSILVVVLGAAACASESPEVPLGPGGEPDPELLLGADVYSRRCATCHGSSGQGGTGPNLADGSLFETYRDSDAQRKLIANGRNGMPAFAGSLSATELDAVVSYTREVLWLFGSEGEVGVMVASNDQLGLPA